MSKSKTDVYSVKSGTASVSSGPFKEVQDDPTSETTKYPIGTPVFNPNTGNSFVRTGASTWKELSGIEDAIKSVTFTEHTSNATYTPPDNLLALEVHAIGGGGGGGGTQATGAGEAAAAGSGASGGYGYSLFAPGDLGDTESIVIGAGGAAPSAGNNPGGDGNPSSFGTTKVIGISGNGGSGSATVSSTTVNAGGVPGAETPTGDYAISGNTGQPGTVVGAVPILTGFASTGPGLFGLRMKQQTVAAGADGDTPGGGGLGAAADASQTARAGGAGGNGRVYLIEYLG